MTEDIPASLEVEGELKKLVEYVTGGARAVYLTENSRAAAVLLDIDLYNALLDAADALDAQYRRAEDAAGIMADILNQFQPKSKSNQA